MADETRPRHWRQSSGRSGGMTGQDWMERITAVLEPKFADINRKLDDLVSRREHDKDMAEIKSDISALGVRVDAQERWREVRPQHVPSEDRFSALVAEVNAIKRQPETTRANIGTIGVIVGVVLTVLGCVGGPIYGALIAYLVQNFAGK